MPTESWNFVPFLLLRLEDRCQVPTPPVSHAPVPELVEAERRLQVGVLLRPADAHRRALRQLDHLDLEVPVAAVDGVRGARRAVELRARHVLPGEGSGDRWKVSQVKIPKLQ